MRRLLTQSGTGWTPNSGRVYETTGLQASEAGRYWRVARGPDRIRQDILDRGNTSTEATRKCGRGIATAFSEGGFDCELFLPPTSAAVELVADLQYECCGQSRSEYRIRCRTRIHDYFRRRLLSALLPIFAKWL